VTSRGCQSLVWINFLVSARHILPANCWTRLITF
jgi:hypothetical protein